MGVSSVPAKVFAKERERALVCTKDSVPVLYLVFLLALLSKKYKVLLDVSNLGFIAFRYLIIQREAPPFF